MALARAQHGLSLLFEHVQKIQGHEGLGRAAEAAAVDPDGAPAIHNSLALKCTDGKVYDITVATGGTLTATERT